MQKIVTFLWFDDNAETAMNFYTSVFPNSRIVSVRRYGDAGPGAKGSVMTGTFELHGQQFMALNAGPRFKFNEAISLMVNCETQAEVDDLWAKLTADGGQESQCGWLKDKFGLSWQIIPTALGNYLGDLDPARAQRAVQAMLGMKKIDIEGLRKAAEGEAEEPHRGTPPLLR